MKPVFSHVLDVRWREMDALGHVNNAQYLSYVEETRVQWFDSMDHDWQQQAASPIVAAIHMDFRRPLHWPNRIRVSLHAEHRGGRSVRIGHRICAADDPQQLYAEGHTVLVWVDAGGKAVTLPPAITDLFNDDTTGDTP